MNWIKWTPSVDLKIGTVVRYGDDSVALVGEVNQNLGLCECCYNGNPDFYSEDLIPHINELIDIVIRDISNGKSK